MGLYLEISRFRCPNCNETIAVNKIQDFSTRFSKREAFTCPHCGTTLNWAKAPHHLAHYSLWAACLTFPMPFTGLYSFQTGIWVLGIFLLGTTAGLMMQKLVIEKPAKAAN
jgi:predicted RNA-binding Zn-ribbon protein involved in translation (DUF1610 family)